MEHSWFSENTILTLSQIYKQLSANRDAHQLPDFMSCWLKILSVAQNQDQIDVISEFENYAFGFCVFAHSGNEPICVGKIWLLAISLFILSFYMNSKDIY